MCAKCRKYKADKAAEYRKRYPEKQRTSNAKWYAKNSAKSCAAARAWYKAHPERMKEVERRRTVQKYGLTLEQWKAMLDSQEGKCKICRTDKPGGQGTWHTDHDHASNEVRGLLCNACNRMLGYAIDRPAILRAGLEYLLQFNLTYEINTGNLRRKETLDDGAQS